MSRMKSQHALSIATRVVLSGALPITACALADVPASQSPAPPPAADVQTLLSAVTNDAARRSGVSAARLHASVVQPVTWPDGSLGCPQPDRAYTQALVPGWRIVIAVPAAPPLIYHASRRDAWVWCAKPGAPVSPGAVY